MIAVTAFADAPVAVLGLGRSGLAAAAALLAGGAEVWAWDDAPDIRAKAEARGVPMVDLHHCDFSGVAALVQSPGIPHTFPEPHPVSAGAREAGIDIICDIDLLARTMSDAAYLGITGTNGKSTTTALIGHILAAAGAAVEVGGNVGVAALDLEPLADGTYVLELSSYQLERIPSVSFDVAVLLNVSPDHLDRHGGLDGYVAAKKRIFDHPAAGAGAVIGMDDTHCRMICLEMMVKGGLKIVPISGHQRAPGGVYAEDGILIDDMDNGQARVLDLNGVGTLPGRHNGQNAAAAYAAARLAGIGTEVIGAAIASFKGLAHRQETIASLGGVTYVNDSKATNADAAAKALACYADIFWIAGGQAKEGGWGALVDALGTVRHAFLIGEAASGLAEYLTGKVAFTEASDLASAFPAASKAAREHAGSAVVLLSPGCASFDQFDDFEARGEAFRALVEALA